MSVQVGVTVLILGLVAEAAAGETLDVLVRRLVCDPLGMAGTGFRPGADARRRPTSTQPESVLSGRTIEDLTRSAGSGA